MLDLSLNSDPPLNFIFYFMQQRTIITTTEDIRNIARDINIFSCRKQIFKVQLNQFSETENQDVEKRVVKFYSLGQHAFWNTLPAYTILVYLFLVFTGIIPFHQLGIVPTIILYAPFATGLVFLLRIIAAFYAKRSLIRMANELQTIPSFSFG